MATPLSYDSPIAVAGAGTWGSSTALHLARRGFKDVTVFDAHAVPSPISAGNDVNKIVSKLSSTASETLTPTPGLCAGNLL